jgi:hypothetical protein
MIEQITLHYRAIEKLGGGGACVLYGAADTRLHQFVALNFLPHEVSKEHYPNLNPGRGGGAWV